MLTAETRRTPTHQRLSIMFECVPGYSVDTRLSEGRSRAADRGGPPAARPLRDHHRRAEDLRQRAAQLCATGETFILEAQVQYAEVRWRAVSCGWPRRHVRYGWLAEGITLQLTNGTSWQGNIFVDRAGCADAGITPEQYDTMLGVVEQLREAFSRRGQSFAVASAGRDDVGACLCIVNLKLRREATAGRLSCRQTGGRGDADNRAPPTGRSCLEGLQHTRHRRRGTHWLFPGR